MTTRGMPKVSLASVERAHVVASPEGALGEVETRAIFGGNSNPIHLHLHRLAPGASVRLAGVPTDCLVYVWQGAVEAGGTRLGPRSSAIVEYGAALTASGCREGAMLLAFKMRARGEGERAGGRVHLLPDEHVPRTNNNRNGMQLGMALHADSQCPTCKLWLHENDFSGSVATTHDESGIHSHSEDEVIFVRAGTMRLGNRLYGAGTALAIAANTKYGFTPGPEGLSFVNFRGAASTFTSGDGSTVFDEVQFWHSQLRRPEYLQPQPT